MKYEDISKIVLELFYSQNIPTHRYTSFDYCYNFFNNSTYKELESNIEKSCLHLAFYLASWGMLRGSSFLLEKSIKHYEPLIHYIIKLKKEDHIIWKIDIDTYTDKNIDSIIEIYKNIQNLIIPNDSKNRHIVLVTKIMLGIFGCIPAYDKYFTDTFKKIFENRCGFTTVNKESLLCLKDFYLNNKLAIDDLHHKIKTIDFETENISSINYSKAKIIDMYGFAKAMYL